MNTTHLLTIAVLGAGVGLSTPPASAQVKVGLISRDVFFGNPEVTPGGKALKFYSSVRIDLRKIESIKQGTEVVGNRVRARIVKNKVAPPFRVAEFDIMFNEGISREGDVIDIGVE
ncbi:MAG: hypothetical protein IIA64_01240, partial [Planctomycetes bacterium]|nr:hypothetical protein [Planctomycetota bacterium]